MDIAKVKFMKEMNKEDDDEYFARKYRIRLEDVKDILKNGIVAREQAYEISKLSREKKEKDEKD